MFSIIDVETTGTDPKNDKVVEIARVDIDENGSLMTPPKSQLINPGIPIPARASAIHWINDNMVKNEPTFEEAWPEFTYGIPEYAVAHNSRFDAAFLPELSVPWIDTYRLALAKWPTATTHSNAGLYHGLKLYREWSGTLKSVDQPHHRAGFDVVVTAAIFSELLNHFTIEEMVEISSKPILLQRIGFGKHKGQKFSEIPMGYLEWLSQQEMDEDLAYTIGHECDRRRDNA